MIHPMQKKNVKFDFAMIYGFVRLSKKKIEKIHRNLRNILQNISAVQFQMCRIGNEGRGKKKNKK